MKTCLSHSVFAADGLHNPPLNFKSTITHTTKPHLSLGAAIHRRWIFRRSSAWLTGKANLDVSGVFNGACKDSRTHAFGMQILGLDGRQPQIFSLYTRRQLGNCTAKSCETLHISAEKCTYNENPLECRKIFLLCHVSQDNQSLFIFRRNLRPNGLVKSILKRLLCARWANKQGTPGPLVTAVVCAENQATAIA